MSSGSGDGLAAKTSMRAGVALGSNLGDRLAHLREARARLLSLHDGSGPFLCSKIYETTPVDCPDGSQPFFNAAIELSTLTPPLDLLAELLRIEIESGRPPNHEFHGPRTLDLDLLYYGDLRISLNTLALPHRGISSRLFVLKPLADICPERVLPNESRMVRDLCDNLESAAFNANSNKFVSYL